MIFERLGPTMKPARLGAKALPGLMTEIIGKAAVGPGLVGNRCESAALRSGPCGENLTPVNRFLL